MYSYEHYWALGDMNMAEYQETKQTEGPSSQEGTEQKEGQRERGSQA